MNRPVAPPPAPTPLVALNDVTVMREGQVVLDRVSLALSPGERLAVAGPNGAGKTTLLRTIVGLQAPSAGTVNAFGTARAGERAFKEVRTKIAYLFQDSDDQLFCPTVLEDVAFGPLNLGLAEPAALAKAREALARLKLLDLADRATYRLSAGEKRLVCLAGILAMEPEALLLDEPTNGLDEIHYARIIETLLSLSAAMIIVSHDMDFLASLATRAMILRAGRLSHAVIHRHPHAHDHVHIHAEA